MGEGGGRRKSVQFGRLSSPEVRESEEGENTRKGGKLEKQWGGDGKTFLMGRKGDRGLLSREGIPWRLEKKKENSPS